MPDDTQAPDAAAQRAWTAQETAEDLIGQVEDALIGGWSVADAGEALTHQGLDAQTAAQLVDDVRALPRPESGTLAAPEVIELVHARSFLRAPGDPLTLVPEQVQALEAALTEAGLPGSTAASVCAELAAMERRMAQVYHRRMRRLGVQGMVVGVLATALLGYGGLYGGPDARWHLVTATFTLGLFVYSAALWRRGRPPGGLPGQRS